MSIDVDKLRNDMLEESDGAFFVGGFGGAMFESEDIRNASDEDLLNMAEDRGFDLDDYDL